MRTPSTASIPSARSRSASERTRRRTSPTSVASSEVDLRELVARDGVERVIVTAQDLSDEAMMDLVRDCGAASVKVSVVPDHINALGPSVAIDDIEGLTILGLNPLVLSSSSRFLKRLLDVAGATAGILVAAPVLALIGRRDQARLARPGPLPPAPDRQGRDAVHGAQVPDAWWSTRRRGATSCARRAAIPTG